MPVCNDYFGCCEAAWERKLREERVLPFRDWAMVSSEKPGISWSWGTEPLATTRGQSFHAPGWKVLCFLLGLENKGEDLVGIFSFPLFGLEPINLGGPESILLTFSVYPCITNRFWKFLFSFFIFG